MRQIVTLVLACWLCSVLQVHAQDPAGKLPTIGFLSPATAQTVRAQLLREALAKHGLVDGKNVRIDVRVAEGRLERLAGLAEALVRDGATLIFATGDPAGLAAQAATKILPIVMIGDDLVGSGLVASLARPGGNITGVSILATELDAKRLEVLKELLPGAERIGILNDPTTSGPGRPKGMAETAARLGIVLETIDVRGPDDLEPAFQALKASGIAGINIVSSSMLFNLRPRLGELSLTNRIPAICQFREMVELGCLASYGILLSDLYALSAGHIAKLLGGAKPNDLPVAQPSRFELVVSLKSARAIGLTLSPAMLAEGRKIVIRKGQSH
jgi:putative tryptophan/tyrosine transport system substrate-binding protein